MRVIVDKSNSAARLYGCTFLANQSVPVRVGYRLVIMHDHFIVVKRPWRLEASTMPPRPKRRTQRTSGAARSVGRAPIRKTVGSAVGGSDEVNGRY